MEYCLTFDYHLPSLFNKLFLLFIISFKIVDEDLDLSKIGAGNDDAEEENPIIAEIIDDRPDSVKQMEVYLSTDKWKKVVGGLF